jgi:cell wall-associated NlpC family hydrolase
MLTAVTDAVSGPSGAHTAAPAAAAARAAARALPAARKPLVRPAARAAGAPRAAARPSTVSADGARGEIALDFALAQLGKPYVYGGTGPAAFDCSGLAQQAWHAAGVSIPRTTQEQARTGTAVPLAQAQLGDLVIFYPDASHVGIYAGQGKVVVAPHAGAVISLQLIKWMPVYGVRHPG